MNKALIYTMPQAIYIGDSELYNPEEISDYDVAFIYELRSIAT